MAIEKSIAYTSWKYFKLKRQGPTRLGHQWLNYWKAWVLPCKCLIICILIFRFDPTYGILVFIATAQPSSTPEKKKILQAALCVNMHSHSLLTALLVFFCSFYARHHFHWRHVKVQAIQEIIHVHVKVHERTLWNRAHAKWIGLTDDGTGQNSRRWQRW